ncbi:MAG: MATE family efflux transporter [Planctomycetota bacterium]
MQETEAAPDQESGNWWTRKCGGRDVLVLAFPLVISTMSFVVMQFCDRLFLTWHSGLDLAASLPAGALSWTAASLPLGIATYANTFVAQYEGASLRSHIGRIVWQAMWLGFACIPLYIVLGCFAEDFFTWIGHSPELVSREADYFFTLSLGSGIVIVNAALGAFFIGRGKTTVIMAVDIFSALVNVLLDYFFIFGLAANSSVLIPEGGIYGAGLATASAQWIKMLILAWLYFRPVFRAEFGTVSGWAPKRRPFLQLLRFGVPNGFQFTIEGMAITLFVLIIARISEDASAATALAFSINMIVFVPIFGLGIAVSTLVGQQIGEGSPELGARATWTAFWIGTIYTLIFAVAYIAIPDWFLAAHGAGAADAEGNHFELVEAQAISMLAFVAVYCFFDTVQIIFVSAIKGAGDTLFVVAFTVISAALFIFAGRLAPQFFQEVDGQVRWWWWCLTGWIILLCVAYTLRFLSGRWRTMTVIEPDLLTEGSSAQPA